LIKAYITLENSSNKEERHIGKDSLASKEVKVSVKNETSCLVGVGCTYSKV
jgi:hypothetical protein